LAAAYRIGASGETVVGRLPITKFRDRVRAVRWMPCFRHNDAAVVPGFTDCF
jgi:hypothetical protein